MSKSIPVPAYLQLGNILDPSGGGLNFTQIDEVVIPVQDLSRVLQRQQSQIYVYHLNQTLVADSSVEIQWGDLSDWTAVSANNIAVTSDAGLPASDGSQDRIITSMGLFISNNIAEWNTTVARRVPTTASAQVNFMRGWASGERIDGNCIPRSPNLLPASLSPGEATIGLSTDITFAAGVTLDYIIEIVVAPRGVLAVSAGY